MVASAGGCCVTCTITTTGRDSVCRRGRRKEWWKEVSREGGVVEGSIYISREGGVVEGSKQGGGGGRAYIYTLMLMSSSPPAIVK